MLNLLKGLLPKGSSLPSIIDSIGKVVSNSDEKIRLIERAIDEKGHAREHGDKFLQRFFGVGGFILFLIATIGFGYCYYHRADVSKEFIGFVGMSYGFISAWVKEIVSFLFGTSMTEMSGTFLRKNRKNNKKNP